MWSSFLLLCAFVAISSNSLQIISTHNSNTRWVGNWKWNVGENIPGDRFLKIHFLNLTNPEEFIDGEIPVVSDRGPYTYRQKKFKGGVKNNGNSVRFNETEMYFFERGLSVGSQEDLLNTINIPLITLIDLVVFSNPIFAPIISDYLRNYGEELTITNLKVEDLLFNGFDVSTFFTNGIIQKFLPDDFEDERFGIFKGINGSDNGVFEVTSTKQNYGEIMSWDGKVDLGIWENNSYCDQIKGTDGSVFAAEIKPTTILKIFDVSACRSFSLVYSETVDFKGILGYRFVYPMDMLRAPTMKPENQCFCKYVNPNDCEKTGTADLSLCRNGISATMKQHNQVLSSAIRKTVQSYIGPYFLTYPHFMDADPMYLEKIIGLNPNSEDTYATFFDVEPFTGTVLQSSKRFQLNLKLRAYEGVPMFADIKEMLFPIFWTDESYVLDDYSANQLRDFLQNDVSSPLQGGAPVIKNGEGLPQGQGAKSLPAVTTPVPKGVTKATSRINYPVPQPSKFSSETNFTLNTSNIKQNIIQMSSSSSLSTTTKKPIIVTFANTTQGSNTSSRPTPKPKNAVIKVATTSKPVLVSRELSQSTQTPTSSSRHPTNRTSKFIGISTGVPTTTASTTHPPTVTTAKASTTTTSTKAPLIYFTTDSTTTTTSKATGYDDGQEIGEKIETSERITSNSASHNLPKYLLLAVPLLGLLQTCIF